MKDLLEQCRIRKAERVSGVTPPTPKGKRAPRKEYWAWRGMQRRCNETDKNNKDYYRYALRGITVCKRWVDSYENFLKDMGEAPEGTSLDRIDNDGNYEPSNCRWATRYQQDNNRSCNHIMTYNGMTKTLREWADHIGIKYNTLNKRRQHGWTVERALTTPVAKRVDNRKG